MVSSITRVFLLLAICRSILSLSAEMSRKELRSKENQKVATQLGSRTYSKSNRVDPSLVVQLSWKPRVFLYRDFLSNEECDYLLTMARVTEEMHMSNNSSIQHPALSESSLGAQDGIAASIEKRISAWTFLPQEYSMPIAITHFGASKEEEENGHHSNKSISAQNVPPLATVILYLSNVSQGGGIVFPQSQFSPSCKKFPNALKPIKGNAILFFTSKLDTTIENSSLHARCPVLEGELWIATKVFYTKPVKTKQVSYWMDENECTDEDQSCPQWASKGECQRNPVFMIGSPDYYGACRKSCNACW